MSTTSPQSTEAPRKRLVASFIATVVFIGIGATSTTLLAKAAYVKAAQPIIDELGRVQVIIDFTDDAHLRYPGKITLLPRTQKSGDDKPHEFFHNPKTEALVADFEKAYGLERTGMTSWVGNSVTAFVTPDQVTRLQDDARVKTIFDDVADRFSGDPTPQPSGSPGSAIWGNTVGAETTSWGHQAVNGKVRTVSNTRKVYIIDSGVAAHSDLSSVSARLNVACGAVSCNPTNPSMYPVVGCYAHSTHVAGIIGAQAGNNTGTNGIYAGANMVSLSVLSRTGSDMCANYSGDPPNTPSFPVYRSRIGYALDYIYWDTLYNNIQQWVNIVNISINSAGVAINGSTPQVNWAKAKKVIAPDTVFVGCGIQPDCTEEEQYRYYPAAFIAQSAGNQNKNETCIGQFDAHYLPRAVPPGGPGVVADDEDGFMVVGAINRYGNRPTEFMASTGVVPAVADGGSNYGDCVDIWAPGDEIVSTWGDVAVFGDRKSVV